MIVPVQFGMMWRTRMRVVDAPEARAASTNSFSFNDSTCARTMRAMYIQLKNASTRMIDVEFCPKIRIATASNARSGRMRNRSVTALRPWSVALPKYAATAPTVTPTTVDSNATTKPIISEIRPAYMISESWSRPRSSVPNVLRGSGPCRC